MQNQYMLCASNKIFENANEIKKFTKKILHGSSGVALKVTIRSTSSGAKMEGLGVSRDDIGGNKIDQTRRAYIKMLM